MRVLMTGLGDIAHKAYLPVLSALPQIELHLATRNQSVLEEAGRRFRVAGLHVERVDVAQSAVGPKPDEVHILASHGR